MMDYLVVDAGFNYGKDKNILFASNDRDEAITAARESGSGVMVIKRREESENEEIIFISPYKSEIGLKL